MEIFVHHSTFLTTSSKCGKINMTKRTLKIIILNGCFQKIIANVRKFATKKKQCFQQKTLKKDKILSFSCLKETWMWKSVYTCSTYHTMLWIFEANLFWNLICTKSTSSNRYPSHLMSRPLCVYPVVCDFFHLSCM